MATLTLILLPLLGLVVGSFLGLVSLRLPAGRPIVVGRSHCDACGRALDVRDLVPLASYVLFRGGCRTCRAAIPRRYPLIELGCAGLGLWAALHHGAPAPALVTALFGWTLLLIAVIDGEHFWLPDALTLPLLAGGLIAAAALAPETLGARVIGAAVGFTSLWLIALVYRRMRKREGLGGGDPRLLAALGAWVGWVGLPSVLLWGSVAGLSLVVARLAARRPLAATDRLPFGVFLAVGGWLTWLYGPLGL